MIIPNNILVVDVETTGLDPLHHMMHGIGAARLDPELDKHWPPTISPALMALEADVVSNEWEFYANFRADEGVCYDPEALEICQVTQEELLNRPIGHDDAFERFNQWVLAAKARWGIKGAIQLAGWNPQFDYRFLKFQYEVLGWECPFKHRLMDIFTLACAYAVYAEKPVAGSAPTSAEACGWFGIEPEPKPHTVYSGVRWEVALLASLLAAFGGKKGN